jgi:predicted ferric reductase
MQRIGLASGLVLVVVVVVVIHVVVVAALPLRFFQFMAALVCLFAVLAVALHRVAQFVFRLVNTPFTFVVRPRWD